MSERTWHGRSVKEEEVFVDNLLGHLPFFSESDFNIGAGKNEYLTLISRDPLPLSGLSLGADIESHESMRIPVAAVSKNSYKLVQHHEVLERVLEALNRVITMTVLTAKVLLSKYGARVWVTIPLPGYEFDPGSGRPLKLRLHCFNSVDTSFAVRVQLAWHHGSDHWLWPEQFRRYHDQSFKSQEIEKFLASQFNERLPEVKDQYKRLFNTKPGRGKSLPAWITDWIDEIVTKEWGSESAARVYHISVKGYDCVVIDKRKKAEVKTHALDVKDGKRIDFLGFKSVENAYHISQVLSWLANEREEINTQIKQWGQIATLIESLCGR